MRVRGGGGAVSACRCCCCLCRCCRRGCASGCVATRGWGGCRCCCGCWPQSGIELQRSLQAEPLGFLADELLPKSLPPAARGCHVCCRLCCTRFGSRGRRLGRRCSRLRSGCACLRRRSTRVCCRHPRVRQPASNGRSDAGQLARKGLGGGAAAGHTQAYNKPSQCSDGRHDLRGQQRRRRRCHDPQHARRQQPAHECERRRFHRRAQQPRFHQHQPWREVRRRRAAPRSRLKARRELGAAVAAGRRIHHRQGGRHMQGGGSSGGGRGGKKQSEKRVRGRAGSC